MSEITGYQAPPRPPGPTTPEEERIRALEDFISRITETFVYRSTSMTLPGDAVAAVPWTTALSNSAALWSSGEVLTVPSGSEGDYVVRCKIVAPPRIIDGGLVVDTGRVTGFLRHNGVEIAVSPSIADSQFWVWSTHIGLKRGDTLTLNILNEQLDSDVVPGGIDTLYLDARRVI